MNLQKQTTESPLYPSFLWSRPERRADKGKLVIMGGHAYYFAAPIAAHSEALACSAGQVSVILPDQLRKMLPELVNDPDIHFVANNPSGSFSKDALVPCLDVLAGSSCLLLAGDFGRSSETLLLTEDIIKNYGHDVVITGDIADQLCANPDDITQRTRTVLVLTFKQLQILAGQLKFAKAFNSQDPLLVFADKLIEFSGAQKSDLIVHHLGKFWACSEGTIAATEDPENMTETGWRSQLAGCVATLLAEIPKDRTAALNCAIYLFVGGEALPE